MLHTSQSCDKPFGSILRVDSDLVTFKQYQLEKCLITPLLPLTYRASIVGPLGKLMRCSENLAECRSIFGSGIFRPNLVCQHSAHCHLPRKIGCSFTIVLTLGQFIQVRCVHHVCDCMMKNRQVAVLNNSDAGEMRAFQASRLHASFSFRICMFQ